MMKHLLLFIPTSARRRGARRRLRSSAGGFALSLAAAVAPTAAALTPTEATARLWTSVTTSPTLSSTTVSDAGATTTTIDETPARYIERPAISLVAGSVTHVCESGPGEDIVLPDVSVESGLTDTLVVTAGAEDPSGDCDMSAPGAGARWGGTPLQLAASAIAPAGDTWVCSAIFYLHAPPPGRADVQIRFPSALSAAATGRQAGALQLNGTAAGRPDTVATAIVGNASRPILTAVETEAPGSWLVDRIQSDEPTPLLPWHGRQVPRWREACGDSAAATSTMYAPWPHPLLIGWLPAGGGTGAHTVAVFRPAPADGGSTTTSTTLPRPCVSDAECEDGDACNGEERCDPSRGCLPGISIDCEDGLICTVDRCDPATGTCSSRSVGRLCDDADECTTDICAPGSGCTYTPNPDADCNGGDGDNDGIADPVDPCPADPRNLCFGVVATDLFTQQAIRINAGIAPAACAGARRDCSGRLWNADFNYIEAHPPTPCDLDGESGCAIEGVEALFGCNDENTQDLLRCDHPAGDTAGVRYIFQVPAGDYVVNLLFAATSAPAASAAAHVFDILVQGRVAHEAFDPVASAGANATAVVRSTMTHVSNGLLLIELRRDTGTPTLRAIEVLGTQSGLPPHPSTTTTTTTLAECGTDSACDDGNACNGTERCIDRQCVAGIPPVCNDGLYCNGQEACDPATGCVAGLPPACDDNVICTVDRCDEATDSCAHVATCSDGMRCDPPTGTCIEVRGDRDGDGLDDGVDPCPDQPRNQCFGEVAIDRRTAVAIRINAAPGSNECAGDRVDCNGDLWAGDFGFARAHNSGGCTLAGDQPCVIDRVAEMFGCVDESTMDLFRCEHWDGPGGEDMTYAFELPDGRYLVNLFFANTYAGTSEPGTRLFDILLEGTNVHPRFDPVAAAGASATAVVRATVIDVRDGSLDITLRRVIENPALKAIEVRAATQATTTTTTTTLPTCVRECPDGLTATPSLRTWGHVVLGTSEVREITLRNESADAAHVRSVAFRTNAGDPADFTVEVGGRRIIGGDGSAHDVDIVIAAGDEVRVPVEFTATEARTTSADLLFTSDAATRAVSLLATGGDGPDDPFLHVVIDAQPVAIDYDGDGSVDVALRGSESHTHEPGAELSRYLWHIDGELVATTVSATTALPLGRHEIALTILDDNVPPRSLTDSVTVDVVSATEAPGVLVLYHEGGDSDPRGLLDTVPATADYAEVRTEMVLTGTDGTIGKTGYAGAEGLLVRILAALDVDASTPRTIAIETPGDGAVAAADTRLLINGESVDPPVLLAAGHHEIEARFAIDSAADLPLAVVFLEDDAAGTPIATAIAPELLTHDRSALAPVINSMTASGSENGSEPVLITGLGFFPKGSVTLNWNGGALPDTAVSVSPTTISLLSPPGIGTVAVSVTTAAGTSNVKPYRYDDSAPPPVVFESEHLATIHEPTQAAWGPDERLYVASLDGTITAYTFDDDYAVIDEQVIDVLAGGPTPDILGLAFDPLDATGHPVIHVAHSRIFARGGTCSYEGTFEYIGRVSKIAGPDFTTVETVVSGLPTSNHDHAVNGLAFDNQGNLMIAVGGNTNAGVEICAFGGVPESPLSGAVLLAPVHRSGFNGAVVHINRDTGLPDGDQRSGSRAETARHSDVRVWSPGFRNSFDLVYTTAGRLYNTDNGPDTNLGPASTGPITQGADPIDIDTVSLLVEDSYHGHPNRNRGRIDPRQNVYRSSDEPDADPTARPSYPARYLAPLASLPSSLNGIEEYRAATFRGALRGALLAQKWNGATYAITLAEDGGLAAPPAVLPVDLQSLDVVAAPGGALIGVDFTDDRLVLARPVEREADGIAVLDVYPWRAVRSGGAPFVIAGKGFGAGDVDNTRVSFGGSAALITEVSATRIRGIVPPQARAGGGPVDLTVETLNGSAVLDAAFTWLADPRIDDGGSAELVVDGRGSLVSSSTFAGSSFILKNTSRGERKLIRARVDLERAVLRDLAFDPAGAAGDPVGKDLTVDNSTGPSVLGHRWMGGIHGGYRVLDLELTDFGPDHTLAFSVDIDPTSIQGAPAPGPGESGSIAGSELAGATFTAWFDDGSVAYAELFPDEITESAATARARHAEPAAPSVSVWQEGSATTATHPAQRVAIEGPAGAVVRLVVMESVLEKTGDGGGGYDLQPGETNKVTRIAHHRATLDATGHAEVTIPLPSDVVTGGSVVITAAVEDSDGRTGRIARPQVLALGN